MVGAERRRREREKRGFLEANEKGLPLRNEDLSISGESAEEMNKEVKKSIRHLLGTRRICFGDLSHALSLSLIHGDGDGDVDGDSLLPI